MIIQAGIASIFTSSPDIFSTVPSLRAQIPLVGRGGESEVWDQGLTIPTLVEIRLAVVLQSP
jgi:hypothetical protein